MATRPKIQTSRRRGAALIELAVCMPVIVLMVLGSMEAASLIFAKQAMTETAYEAAMVAVKRKSSNSDAISAAEQIVSTHRLKGLRLEFNPPDIANARRGDQIEVTATVPASSQRLLSSRIIGVDTITARAVMIKE